jgi:hypothetical protein
VWIKADREALYDWVTAVAGACRTTEGATIRLAATLPEVR